MTDSLTLHASGPVTVEESGEYGEFTVTETETREIHAETAVDADFLATEGDIYRRGCYLDSDELARTVAQRRTTDEATYYVTSEQADEWTLSLNGHIESWLSVSVYAADTQFITDRVDQRATVACHILRDLAEYAENRPLLAIVDLLDGYDVSGFDRETVLDRIADDDREETDAESEHAEKVRADGGEA